MARPASRNPTELELEILKIIWRDGELSVREVRLALMPTRELTHNSVLTVMNIMTRKKYLTRRKEAGQYLYAQSLTQHNTVRRMLGDLLNRLFNGSTHALMCNLLQMKDLDRKELQEIRKVLDAELKKQPPVEE